jgi:hypothetical protein
MVAISALCISKRAIGSIPVSLFRRTLFYLWALPSCVAFGLAGPAGLPRSFDGFTMPNGFQKTPKMHD